MADEGWREGAEQIPGILNETPDAVTEEEFWSAQDAAEYWTVPVRGALASRLSRHSRPVRMPLARGLASRPCHSSHIDHRVTEESCSQLASETKGLSHLCLGFHSQILCSELTMHDFL